MLATLALRRPRIHATLATVSEEYDGFILDQFGVLHNGVTALPGAVEAVKQLYEQGKKMVILSNTSAPSAKALERLPKYGFEQNWFLGAVTSGEEASRFLRAQPAPKRIMFLTWDDRNPENPRLTAPPYAFIDQCGDGIEIVGKVDEANWLLLHGSEVWHRGPDQPPVPLEGFITDGDLTRVVDPLLQECAKKGIKMVCANPDDVVVTPDGGEAFMPGKIARRYQEITGKKHYIFGKPDPKHFVACVKKLEDCNKIIHVGDSLHHDVKGALEVTDLDVLFVTSGIHASALGTAFGKMPRAESLDRLFEETSVIPTDVIPAFRF